MVATGSMGAGRRVAAAGWVNPLMYELAWSWLIVAGCGRIWSNGLVDCGAENGLLAETARMTTCLGVHTIHNPSVGEFKEKFGLTKGGYLQNGGYGCIMLSRS